MYEIDTYLVTGSRNPNKAHIKTTRDEISISYSIGSSSELVRFSAQSSSVLYLISNSTKKVKFNA